VEPVGYKRPESVLVVIYTRRGEVLLLRRVKPEDFWQSVTGSLWWSEVSPETAARRELREETGLEHGFELVDHGQRNVFSILPEWRERYAPDCESNTEHVFTAVFRTRPRIRLNPREHTTYRWLNRDAAAALASSRTNREAILRFVPLRGRL
jgi:dATP pyrophosphohydrolase